MITEYFIPNPFPTGIAQVSQTPLVMLSTGSHKLVLIIRKKERLVLNYFVNFLDGRAYTATFPSVLELFFNFES